MRLVAIPSGFYTTHLWPFSKSKFNLKSDIHDKSLVGGKVPKCITSILYIVYFIPIDKNIAEYKVYVNPARWYAELKYILQLLP